MQRQRVTKYQPPPTSFRLVALGKPPLRDFASVPPYRHAIPGAEHPPILKASLYFTTPPSQRSFVIMPVNLCQDGTVLVEMAERWQGRNLHRTMSGGRREAAINRGRFQTRHRAEPNRHLSRAVQTSSTTFRSRQS